MENRIRDFCYIKEVIDEEQEGFCPGKSTVRYLYKLSASLKDAQRRRLNAIVLCLDLNKAFNSVWVPALISKLSRFGIEGPILSLIISFLTCRKVTLIVNGNKGNKRKCGLFGLPQGSVLSPLLFILFITDMLNFRGPECSNLLKQNSTSYKYADDGTMTFIHNDLNQCYKMAQEACDHIGRWCKKWKLSVNCDKNKTEAIIIKHVKGADKETKLTMDQLPLLEINGKHILYVEKSKVLGLTIDDRLKYDKHALQQLKSCWFTWYNISRHTTPTRGLNHSSLTTLFCTVVQTKLMYASPVWLDDNVSVFSDFWSRVLLKISGCHYHPKRLITECALGIPPLHILQETITLRFNLKCMNDRKYSGLLLQLEEEKSHPYNHHTSMIKKFLLWKNDTKTIDLSKVSASDTLYDKEQIREYTKYLWTQHIRQSIPECDILDEIEDGMLHVQRNSKFLFPRYTTRASDTRVLNLIHGSSTSFRSFAFSLGLEQSPTCTKCNLNVNEDSYHSLFECSKHNSRLRDNIPQSNDRKLFGLKILMTPSTAHIQIVRDMCTIIGP